jgi:3',5'-cyclic-nucleotide phosphodiesterase
MIYLIELQNGQEYTIANNVVIGRKDLRKDMRRQTQTEYLEILNPDISRLHAKIYQINNHYFIQDLNSTNGTFVNGNRISPGVMHPLEDQVYLNLGKTGFQIRLEKSQTMTDGESLSSIQASNTGNQPESLSLLTDEHQQPDVSMVLDASRIINELRGKADKKIENHDEVVKRLQVMIDVSISLGEIQNKNELLRKITDSIFEIFSKAGRALIIIHDEKTGESTPLTAIDKNGNNLTGITISTTIINEVLKNKNSLLLMDAMSDSRFESQESIVDLSLKSVMCAPLLFGDQVLGFIQIDTREGSSIFSQEDLQVLTGISSQVAIALKNSQLFEEIELLFEGFVRASVRAIEARDPGTAGHSFRVADYTEQLAMVVDSTENYGLKDVWFDKQQMQEIRYAALLHDFGKVGVREHVLTKAKKLYPHELELIKQRFKYAKACLEKNFYKNLIDKNVKEQLSHTEFYAEKKNIEKQLKEEVNLLGSFLDKIIKINEPERLSEEFQKDLSHIYQYQFSDEDKRANLITDFEFSLLGLTYGSLNPEERIEIESHVSHTFAFLQLIPWTGSLSNIPDIAHAHHERLDGSGYPRGLCADEIPVQSKIMAITDVYDALTAGDRPYRQGVPAEHALDIIGQEVKKGKLDEILFKIFVESKSYQLN